MIELNPKEKLAGTKPHCAMLYKTSLAFHKHKDEPVKNSYQYNKCSSVNQSCPGSSLFHS